MRPVTSSAMPAPEPAPADRPVQAAQIAQVVAATLGADVADVSPMEPRASSGRTFAVELTGGRQVVAKLSLPGRPVAPMARNLDVLGALGVPVPRVLGTGSWDGDPAREVLVMSRLPGRDLHRELPAMTGGQLSVLAREVIAIQAAVAGLPVSGGCGFVAIGEPGTRTWLDVVRQPNGYAFADPLPPDTVELAPRLWQLIDAVAGRLAQVQPVCFLDDLTTKNVLIDGGRLSGVVDFDVICQGDSRFHLGLTAAAVVTVEHAPLGGHYASELIRAAGLDTEGQRFVDLYAALFLINFLGAEDPHRPGPWRARAALAARQALDRAAAYFTP